MPQNSEETPVMKFFFSVTSAFPENFPGHPFCRTVEYSQLRLSQARLNQVMKCRKMLEK